MSIRRSVTVALAIVLAAGGTSVPGSTAQTGAESTVESAARAVRFVDGRGDVPYPRGDIVVAQAVQYLPGGSLVLDLRAARPTNPYRHRLWQQGVSQITWLLDTTRAGPDWNYRVTATAAADGPFTAGVFGRDGTRICTAVATFPLARDYRVAVPTSCVGLVWRLRAQLAWDHQLSTRGPESVDRVPNRGWLALWA